MNGNVIMLWFIRQWWNLNANKGGLTNKWGAERACDRHKGGWFNTYKKIKLPGNRLALLTKKRGGAPPPPAGLHKATPMLAGMVMLWACCPNDCFLVDLGYPEGLYDVRVDRQDFRW